jgi:hypothetical protein
VLKEYFGIATKYITMNVNRYHRRHWPKTRTVWRRDRHYGRVEAMEWVEDNNIEHVARMRVQLPTSCPEGASFRAVALGLLLFGL